MAAGDNNGAGADGLEATHEPRECMPCRGSGHVISNLGGSPSTIACPWCGGGGVRVPGTDAQTGWPVNEVPAPAEASATAAGVTAQAPASPASS